MKLTSAEVIHRLLSDTPARFFGRRALGTRHWMEHAGTLPRAFRTVLLAEELLPYMELSVLLDPLRGTLLDSLPSTYGPVRGAKDAKSGPGPSPLEKSPSTSEVVPPARKSWPCQDNAARKAALLSLTQAREIASRPAKLLAILQRVQGAFVTGRAAAQTAQDYTVSHKVRGVEGNTAGIIAQTAQERNVIFFPGKKAAIASGLQKPFSSVASFAALEARAEKKLRQWMGDRDAESGGAFSGRTVRKIEPQHPVGTDGKTANTDKAWVSSNLLSRLLKDRSKSTHTGTTLHIDPEYDSARDMVRQEHAPNPLQTTTDKGASKDRLGTTVQDALIPSLDGIREVVRQKDDTNPDIAGTKRGEQRRVTAEDRASKGRIDEAVRSVLARRHQSNSDADAQKDDASDPEIREAHKRGRFQFTESKEPTRGRLETTIRSALAPDHDGNYDAVRQKDSHRAAIGKRQTKGRIQTTVDTGTSEGRLEEAICAALAPDYGSPDMLSQGDEGSLEVAGPARIGRPPSMTETGASAGYLEAAIRLALTPAAGTNRDELARIGQVIHSLERIVESLINIEANFPDATAASGPKRDQPTVQWLEDEDLAGRLHRILKRQARRGGIDLS